MHRDKIVVRILLIFSVVHVAAAAPAIVRQRSQDVDEVVTVASEKRGNSGNTPRGLYPVRQVDNGRPSAPGTAQLDNDPPPASEAPHDPPPASEAPHDPPPASEAPHDPPPASGAPHYPPSALGTPQLDNDPQPASGASHPHNDPLTASETSSVHDNPPFGLDEFDTSYRYSDVHYVPSSDESDALLSHDHLISYAPALHGSNTPPTNSHISDIMKERVKHVVGIGAVVGMYTGLAYGLYKVLSGFHLLEPTGGSGGNLKSSSESD